MKYDYLVDRDGDVYQRVVNTTGDRAPERHRGGDMKRTKAEQEMEERRRAWNGAHPTRSERAISALGTLAALAVSATVVVACTVASWLLIELVR